jgi:LuxR family transcriptional regulator, regulator of acetate metabolism
MTKQQDAVAVGRTLAMLHRTTGVPITYGGLVDSGKLRVGHLAGTTSKLLLGLTVHAGRGLGGRTLVLGRPVAVRDYHDATMISHDYDEAVRDAGIRAAIAVPVVVRRVVRAVLYGARREAVQFGDRTAHAALAAARDLEQELAVRDEVDRRIALLEQRHRPTASARGEEPFSREALRQAHAELRILAAQANDEEVRRRVSQACDALSTALGMPTAPQRRVVLAPRELDVLSCVALGHTNGEIANDLGLEAETVKSYLRSAMRKLDSHTRMQAVVAARRAGLLP